MTPEQLDDLVPWLRAQLDDDERVAKRTASVNCWGGVLDDAERHAMVMPSDLAHIARHDPARVLREVEAKRRILDLASFDAQFPDFDGGYESALEDVLKLLALPYADRPGYRTEWRP